MSKTKVAQVILPCHCGHKGQIDCTFNGFWHVAKCPACPREVTAFTPEGLVDSWNKPAAEPEKQNAN